MTSVDQSELLKIAGLHIGLPSGGDRQFGVENLDLRVRRGEIVCIVGESGSGKSLTALAILRLLPEPGLPILSGAISFLGRDIAHASEEAMLAVRGRRIGMIFQEPLTALNPIMRVERQLTEALAWDRSLSRGDKRARALAALAEAGCADAGRVLRCYPFQLSGGLRQRAMIAMALINRPELLIADEPTTALDVTTQKHILGQILALRDRTGIGVLFITHDFGVVAEIADRVAVLRYGQMVEEGDAKTILAAPSHPYTRQLIDAVPRRAPARGRALARHEAMLEVEKVSKSYGRAEVGGGLVAVDDVSFSVGRGEVLGIVGESGSGKSTLGRIVAGLTTPSGGAVRIAGRDRSWTGHGHFAEFARHVQVIFQDPMSSLNPRRRIEATLVQGALNVGQTFEHARKRAAELLERVGLPVTALSRYPHEFSGGQKQRIAIARALMMEPNLIVADEPVSALDVSIQAQVMKLLSDIRSDLGVAFLFITHDLAVASAFCDRLAVMKNGAFVETGLTANVLNSPSHPYTRNLIASVPGGYHTIEAS